MSLNPYNIMKKPFNPDEEILHYCEHICNAHVQTLRLNKDTGTWYWDYPATAAICHDRGRSMKKSSYSHRPKSNEFHQVLDRKLRVLGEIGKQPKIPGKRYPIGNCAEQHAANSFMKQYGENDLNNLYFSKAMRPRTKEVFDYCDNCKDTFPNL